VAANSTWGADLAERVLRDTRCDPRISASLVRIEPGLGPGSLLLYFDAHPMATESAPPRMWRCPDDDGPTVAIGHLGDA